MKEQFIQALIEKGYKAVNENGIVMVEVSEDKVGDAQSDMTKLAMELDYHSSYGVRLRNE